MRTQPGKPIKIRKNTVCSIFYFPKSNKVVIEIIIGYTQNPFNYFDPKDVNTMNIYITAISGGSIPPLSTKEKELIKSIIGE